MLHLALVALPLQPDTAADVPIWQKVETLGPAPRELLGAILRKLARVRSPYKMHQGVEFILDRVGDAPVGQFLLPALSDTVDEESWPHLWQELIRHCKQDNGLHAIGRDWLRGREDRPEWAFVWQRLVEQGFELETLHAVGRDWLCGREDRPRMELRFA
jgi:hypothetical protein